MGHVRFLPKVVIDCSRTKKGFDCKNNSKHHKSAHFWLNNISKINCRIPVVFLYTLSRLALRKFQLVQVVFK